MTPKVKSVKYTENQRVLCKYGGYIYDAKIVEAYDTKYLVHYNGWRKRFDEWVKLSEADHKLQPFTEEAHEKAKNAIKAARSASKSNVKEEKKEEMEEEEEIVPPSRESTGRARVKASRSDRLVIAEDIVDSIDDPVIYSNFDKPIVLPINLSHLLVDDNYMIVRQGKLTALPVRFTVYQIVQEYCAEKGYGKIEDIIDRVIAFTDPSNVTPLQLAQHSIWLKEYFDVVFGCQLLYKTERPQYSSQLEKAREGKEPRNKRKSRKDVLPAIELEPSEQIKLVVPSEVYGFPHLVRLMSRLEDYFKLQKWNTKNGAVEVISTSVHDFLRFLNDNIKKYWNVDTDYEVVVPVKATHRN